MPRVHPLLIQAKHKAEAYRVLKRRDGVLNVWRFKSWDHKDPGWRLVEQVRSRTDAEQTVLQRLGLAPPVIVITYQPAEAMFTWGHDGSY